MKNVRVIRPDQSGHSMSECPAEQLIPTIQAKREVLAINGVCVRTVEDFLEAVEVSEDTPEVWIWPPMAGG